MTVIKRIPKFLKDELVFIIGSFIVVVIPTVFIIIGFLSLVNTTRSGIASLRGYMYSQVSSSIDAASGGGQVQDSRDYSFNSVQSETGGAVMDIARGFAALGVTSAANRASESLTPYVSGLSLWAGILLLRFIWWNKPKRYYIER